VIWYGWALAAAFVAVGAPAAHAQQRDSIARDTTARDSAAARDVAGLNRSLGLDRSAPGASGDSASIAFAAAAAGDTLRISRTGAIDEALAHNPQLEVARQQVIEARAQRLQDWSIPDPTGSASIINQGGTPSGKPYGATLTVPFPDKFRLNYNIGESGVKSSTATYTALRQQIASQTAQTYDSLRTAIRHHNDLDESRRLSAEFLQKTIARYDAGTVAKLDVIRARVDLGSSVTALIANARDIANARASLNRLMGRGLALPIAASDTLGVPPALPPLAPIEQHALDARPELAGLNAQEAGARATTHLAEEFWVPDLFFGLSADAAAPNSYYANKRAIWQYGLSAPLPIFLWQHLGGEIAQSRHHELELAASYRDTRAMVDQDVRAAYATAVTALQQAIFIRDQLLPSAREAYHVASVSYGLGGSSALDVLQARRDLTDAESQYTDALSSANAAQADLERAAATPLAPYRAGDPNGH
jgi:cobalt-zinc-cadmium efflux system outer membrane protein